MARPSLTPGPTLQTARLTLRPPVEADLDAWAALTADPVARQHLGGPKPRPVAWRSLATHAGSWALRGFGMFSVLHRASGRWVGHVGPWCPEAWPGTEVGWSLLRDAWGQGYATEAATAAIGWAVTALGWTDIIHTIAPANLASAAVAQRLGSVNRGVVRMPEPFAGETVDLWVRHRKPGLPEAGLPDPAHFRRG